MGIIAVNGKTGKIKLNIFIKLGKKVKEKLGELWKLWIQQVIRVN